ncbi:MAG: HAD hydrolase-like protein [Spirochaetes bacterium]|nr:HAD hydrolase-like protein [Spirochaetota bacterium]
MPPQPQAVLFDLGDTLIVARTYRVEAGVAAMLDAAAHRNGATVDQVVALARELNVEFGRRANDSSLEYSQRVFHRMLYDSLGVSFDRSEAELERLYWDAAFEFLPEPGVAEMLAAVRETGVRMGVVSNASFSGEVLCHELEKHGLLSYFEFLISTADYGLRKPHPQIFRVGLQRTGVAPEQTWYVGNSLQFDMAGAVAAGITPVWYNRVGVEGAAPEAAGTITHWSEFPALLRAARADPAS